MARTPAWRVLARPTLTKRAGAWPSYDLWIRPRVWFIGRCGLWGFWCGAVALELLRRSLRRLYVPRGNAPRQFNPVNRARDNPFSIQRDIPDQQYRHGEPADPGNRFQP